VVQRESHVSDGNPIEAIVARLSLPASDTETIRTNGAGLEESDDSNSEVQRQTAKLASKLRKIRTRRDRMKREIATRIHTLPDKEVMKKERRTSEGKSDGAHKSP
jgi:hypothetical protein